MIANMLRFPDLMLDDLSEWLGPAYAKPTGRVGARLRSYPPLNMGVTDKSVEIYFLVPGVDPDEIDITLEKNLLSISGERKSPVETREGEKEYLREERFKGTFKRVITLPEDVDPDKTDAVYENGVLHLSIAKRADTQPRKIKLNIQ